MIPTTTSEPSIMQPNKALHRTPAAAPPSPVSFQTLSGPTEVSDAV